MQEQQENISKMRENPFMTFNHIEIGTVEPDHAEVWLDRNPQIFMVLFMVVLFSPWLTAAQV